MKAKILGIGEANPGEAIAQDSIANFMLSAHGLEDRERKKLNFLYRKSGISARYSVLQDFEKDNYSEYTFFPNNEALEPFPGTKDRMEVFANSAPDLAANAAKKALSKSNTKSDEITHLILVSCTGMVAPGVELELIESLGLNNSVERYCIHFMGCYAAFTGMKLGDRILRSDPDSKVLLVCVELCTLHFQKDYNEDNLLANSLFGDGAAAAVLGISEEVGLEIEKYSSHVLKEGEKDMAWGIGDFGFEMMLSKYIPSLLDKGIERLKSDFEDKFAISTIKNYAIHPGGKQIIEKVQSAFGITTEKAKHSFEVLKNFGNMSSVTILYVLARMMEDKEVTGNILALGFGPGLTLEAMKLKKS